MRESIYGLRNIYDDTIIKRKIEKIKEHIQEISENISGSVPTPVPSISTGNGSVEKSINESKYTAIKKNEHVRFKGSDYKKGQIVLKKGDLIKPSDVRE